MKDIILFGAGTIGRLIARELTAQGNPPIMFADNDPAKWHTAIEGIMVRSPEYSQEAFPGATWIATVLRTPYPKEIETQLSRMGVKTEPLMGYIPANSTPIAPNIYADIYRLCADYESKEELGDQYLYRSQKNHSQRPHSDIRDVYFPSFIKKLPHELFIDCGAADGDTVKEVLTRWPHTVEIASFEPDLVNFQAFQGQSFPRSVVLHYAAVSDFNGKMAFTATGDQTAHLGGVGEEVPVVKLDSILRGSVPTFIKMDIEGAELEGLWGARELIQKHSPVLAICAYHTGDHLWQIPLLIHAINPSYKLYLRRYLPAAWELIWYAVPPDRIEGK